MSLTKYLFAHQKKKNDLLFTVKRQASWSILIVFFSSFYLISQTIIQIYPFGNNYKISMFYSTWNHNLLSLKWKSIDDVQCLLRSLIIMTIIYIYKPSLTTEIWFYHSYYTYISSFLQTNIFLRKYVIVFFYCMMY
jgi:hypothetical protein